MWTFCIAHIENGEVAFIHGYNENDAFRRAPGFNQKEWRVVQRDYED